MKKLNKISKKYKIPLIEDSAEALGSKYNGKYAGKLYEEKELGIPIKRKIQNSAILRWVLVLLV